jgi:hypothetical protein
MIRNHWRSVSLCLTVLAVLAGQPRVVFSQERTAAEVGSVDVQSAGTTSGAGHKARLHPMPAKFAFPPIDMQPLVGVDGAVVTGAPYSADVITEVVQVLVDGNRIVRRHNASVARDSEGRTRRETVLAAVGTWVPESVPKFVTILDPVAGVFYQLDDQHQVARRQAFTPGSPMGMTIATHGAVAAATGGVAVYSDTATITARSASGVAGVPVDAPPPPPPPPPPPGAVTSASAPPVPPLAPPRADTETPELGTQTIEGVEATGTRTVVTIPAGEIGNEQPIKIVSESWYSNELKTSVLTKRSDPRFGETTYRLANITRSEPAASLFEVPAGYAITDDGPPAFKFRAAPPPR